MGLFDKKDHIKTRKELHDVLKKDHIFEKDRKLIEKKAEKYIDDGYSGMSKKEWKQKVVRPLEKDTKDRISPKEARHLKDLGK